MVQQARDGDEGKAAAEGSPQPRPSLVRDIPPIVTKPSLFRPVANRLTRRIFSIWYGLCVIGTVPFLLAKLGIDVPPALQALGWGLWLPGGGFVAVGGWFILLFPAALLLFLAAFWLWVLSGAVFLPPAVWIISAIGAYFAADASPFRYAWVIVPLVAASLLVVDFYRRRQTYLASARLGARRAVDLPTMLTELDAVAVGQPDAAARELTPDELAASRYLLNLAQQPIGSLDGFTLLDNFQLAAIRYQLNYLSYGLALLQCKYMPNFHGYLNRAQQYGIESLAHPKVCAYWKLESLWGLFRWNPDPIDTRDNIMLTGLSLPALSTYAANTGDRRYEQENSLHFRPFKSRSTTYKHNAKSFVDSILSNWNSAAYVLYPCEPHWVFPICNAYAVCGIIPYDRINATSHAASMHQKLMDALESEFITPDGGIHPELSSLIGVSPFWVVTQMQFDNMLSLSQVYNAIHPGYAKRWYAIGRHDFLRLGPDGLSVKEVAWQDCVDFGNYQKNPGMALATIALGAREHGDDVIANAAFAKADELLPRIKHEGVLAYEGTSNSANINLAVARWARRDDWQDLITIGPSRAALSGPILTDCDYPDVLVARAMSDGTDLDLVLYNGSAPGSHRIRIERLKPGKTYEATWGKPECFTAQADGAVVLEVELSGRTHINIRPTTRSC